MEESMQICGHILSSKNYSYFILKCAECDSEFEEWATLICHLEHTHLDGRDDENAAKKIKAEPEQVLLPQDGDSALRNAYFIKEEDEHVLIDNTAFEDDVEEKNPLTKEGVEEDEQLYSAEAEVTDDDAAFESPAKSQRKRLKTFNFDLLNANAKEASLTFLQQLEKHRVLWISKAPAKSHERTGALLKIKTELNKQGWTSTEAGLRRTISRIVRQCQQAREDLTKQKELDDETHLLYNLCQFMHADTDTVVDKANASNRSGGNLDDETDSGDDDSGDIISKDSATDSSMVSIGKFKNVEFKSIRLNKPGNRLATDLINLFRENPVLWDTKDKHTSGISNRKVVISSWIPIFKERHNVDFSYDDLSYNLQMARRHFWKLQKRKELNTSAAALLEQLSFLPQPPSRTEFKCEHCNKTSTTLQTHQAHLYAAHKIGERPYKCSDCDKSFTNGTQMLYHVKLMHTKQLDYPCPQCDQRFVAQCYLDLHMDLHMDVKNFICDTCGQRFRRRSSLLNHETRIHLRQRNFQCSMCPKAFYTKPLLRDHINAHLNIRNYKCPTCEKCFHSAHALMRHKQIHAPIKKYACKLCEARFHQFVGLNAHMKNRHKFVSAAPGESAS